MSNFLEKFRVTADPLVETKFVTNNGCLYVRGHNPTVNWFPGPSVMSFDIKVTATFPSRETPWCWWPCV